MGACYNDYLSDTVYSRYTVGSPTVDPATGWVYLMTTNGGVKCFSPDGKIQWEYSLMERFGRLTFPNGRTGAPVIDGNLVIVRGVTSYWGKQGLARDRFYASINPPARRSGPAPGVGPERQLILHAGSANVDGRRVFYVGTGDGNGGRCSYWSGTGAFNLHKVVNASVVIHDGVLYIHGKENIDAAEEGV